ncbi:MAG: response regulator transcription factor [Nisaea sp.]|uniref:response regulator transcription factor n=1 Tax=Nisaea sp. TaxID=2024842 RepID=UPI001B0DD7B9|nr:response regulator transcription factor [Nisaea sp.]MBO6562638.1 response regulator transcription factor [Nisaea sp.]
MFKSLLVADDHNVVRETFVDFLRAAHPGLTLFQCANFQAAWRAREIIGEPDAILMDWHMPGSTGLTGTRRTVEIFPNSKVVIFSGDLSNSDLEAARSLGVAGYIPKSYSARAVVDGLALLHQTGSYFPSCVSWANASKAAPAARRHRCGTRDIQTPISPRQVEVLGLAAAGFLNKEIANRLSISEPTVKEHMSNILRSLRAKNRTEAARIARELSLI